MGLSILTTVSFIRHHTFKWWGSCQGVVAELSDNTRLHVFTSYFHFCAVEQLWGCFCMRTEK